ncbi:MAG: type VI secretion system ATPase TssH, partial [Verrucomicrobiota bacterium]
MADISRSSLFGKLNSLGYKAVESATVFCKLRGNPYVEFMHFLHQLLELQDSDLHRILKHFEMEPSRLAADMTSALDALPRGATSISDFSPHLENSIERGWVFGSLLYDDAVVRTAYIVIGLLKTPGLKNVLPGISGQFQRIRVEELTDQLPQIVDGSPEDSLKASDGSQVGGGVAPGVASGATAPAEMGKEEALKQFTVDLTEQARSTDMDPILGRDEEI